MPPSNATVVRAAEVELEVAVTAQAAASRIAFTYRLDNRGPGPVAVFDRGDSLAVATRRLKAGDVASPAFEATGGDLVLRHVAHALPKPTPTVPRVPLAARVEPGASLSGQFDVTIGSDVKRLRWCLGTGVFDEASYVPVETGKPSVWRAPFAAADSQRVLCTPWYLVAERRFETP